jgi:DNA-binding response OmpR family regulator
MYQKLWNDKYYDNGNALNVHIRRLRKKLEVKPDQPELIITKWGLGYKFEV